LDLAAIYLPSQKNCLFAHTHTHKEPNHGTQLGVGLRPILSFKFTSKYLSSKSQVRLADQRCSYNASGIWLVVFGVAVTLIGTHPVVLIYSGCGWIVLIWSGCGFRGA